MMWLSLLLLSLVSAADYESLDQRWLTGIKVVDKNPNYQNQESITRPKGTKQLLFAVLRSGNSQEGIHKDCVYYQIPDHTGGELVITSVPYEKNCEMDANVIFSSQNLKDLQFSIEQSQITFWMTSTEGVARVMQASLLNSNKLVQPKLYDSSTSRGVFYFAPNSKIEENKNKILIGELADEYPKNPCSFEKESCQRCRYGTYRINTGEYFCGIDRCGQKNQPACVRGKKWQRTREEFSCRTNTSHVYCQPGLIIDCEGERALCR